jgi:glycosyltransferase involved in cell wall biosynthesis
MRCGLPVVASDVGGVREAVVHGETGFLVAEDDLRGCVGSLGVLLEDGELRAKMGEKGRARYLRHFTFDRMFAETLALYGEVTGKS